MRLCGSEAGRLYIPWLSMQLLEAWAVMSGVEVHTDVDEFSVRGYTHTGGITASS
jgi:hypothetical protein